MQPEFRKDLVSGDWILIAPGRKKKDKFLKKAQFPEEKGGLELETSLSGCPFEDPQASGNPYPLLWYPRPNASASELEDLKSWFVQVIPNKFPLLYSQKECPIEEDGESGDKLGAVGYHEVIITRDHNRPIDKMTVDEVQLILKAYKERYRVLAKDPCVKYILIFHNHGRKAGASLFHPHSQLIALPIIDPDVARSLAGASDYFAAYRKCVHCVMLEKEIKDKTRIVEENEHFVSVVPYAPRVSYETRIYPKKHFSRFEDTDKDLFPALAEILRNSIYRINTELDDPHYNFFIHTAGAKQETDFYHWHIEILPRGFDWAGLELGGGVEVVLVPPEEAAENLRKVEIGKTHP